MREYIVSPFGDFKTFQGIQQAPRRHGWAVIEGANKVTNADHLHVVQLCANPDGSATWVRPRDGSLVMGHKVLTVHLWRYRSEARKEKKRIVKERKLSRSQYTRDSEIEPW